MSLVIGLTDDPAADASTVAAPRMRGVYLNGHVRPSRYFRWKRYVDFGLALVLLVPGLPIIGLLMLLMRLTSRGPGLYRQVRVGQDGRRFALYKIRTMRHDAEAKSGAVWAGVNDPRITRVGRVLRHFHFDELPQLFNVLRGEMSLVGPRPERPEFVRLLSDAVPGYRSRLAVRPGVTGLAQLNLPPDTHVCCVCRKVVLDLDYVQHAGLLFDLRLLLCTLLRLPKLPAIDLLWLLRLRRKVRIQGCILEDDEWSAQENRITTKPDELDCPAMRKLAGGNGKSASMIGLDIPGLRTGLGRQTDGNGHGTGSKRKKPKPR